MIQCEFQNIEELKTNEACETSETAIVSSLNKFFLNMLSDQVKASDNFNPWSWPENMPSKDTSQ